MRTLRRLTSAAALGAVLAVAAPLAANASVPSTAFHSADYPPPPNPGQAAFVAAHVADGGFVAPVSFDAGVFKPGIPVRYELNGTGPAPVSGMFLAADLGTFTLGTSRQDGSVAGSIAFPASAAGLSYVLTFPGDETASGAPINALVTVLTASTATSGVGSGSSSATTLPTTGSYVSLMTVWSAVGLLALGAGILTVRSLSRRRRRAGA